MNSLHEQCDGMISIDGTSRQLPILYAWHGSSAVYWINAPFVSSKLYIRIGKSDLSGFQTKLFAHYHPVRGMWRVYVPGTFFSAKCETWYQIGISDENEQNHVYGEGKLRVNASHIQVVDDKKKVSYAWWPDGKARKIVIEEDKVGEPVFSVGEIVDAPVGRIQEIFAFNKATGFFHSVSTFFDEANEPMLSVSDEPVEAGEDRFVEDVCGFYRRIECFTDESEATALQTGEITE